MVKTSGKSISKGNNKNQEQILPIPLVICIVKGATKSYFSHYSCVVIIFSMRVYLSLRFLLFISGN